MPAFIARAGVGLFALTFIGIVSGCSVEAADEDGEEDEASSSDALITRPTSVRMVYLGSSSFLRQCAGNTLGCGRAVSSVPDSTPYFSAPRSWGRGACNQWWTFRANGRCVEAQRFEVSDRNNKIEGNPAVFRRLGLPFSDGRNCAGSGMATVTITPGRNCDD